MYKVRVEFSLPKGSNLKCEEPKLEFRYHGILCTLLCRADSTSISKSNNLLLISEGFKTNDEAYSFGYKVINGLYWCAAKLIVGVRPATGSTGGATEYLQKKALVERGIRLLNGGNCITVYDDSMTTSFTSVELSGTVLKPIDRFVELMISAFDMNINLNEKEVLAVELYISSFYEASELAKFLSLIIALESLIECKIRRQEAKNHVEQLIELTKESDVLFINEIDSIIGSLKWLKSESISYSGKNLVERYIGGNIYNGFSAKKFFEHCYKIRSELVHYGKMGKDISLTTVTTELSRMVSDLLIAIICTKNTASHGA